MFYLYFFDGKLAQNQPHDTTNVEQTFTGSVHVRNLGSPEEYRATLGYSYRLVHAQESLRLLDLRLTCVELQDLTELGKLFDGACRRILGTAIAWELECLAREQGPVGLDRWR